MSDILFTCPECSKSLAVDEAGAGCTIPCSDCGEPVVVPPPEQRLECPQCGCGLWTSAGLNEDTCLCPDCDAEIALPPGFLQTEGGTIRVKRGKGAPTLELPSAHVKRGGGPAVPPKLFSVRPSVDSIWPDSRRVVRQIWLIVFGCAVLLVFLIYMDVFFDAGLRALSVFGPKPIGRTGDRPVPETAVEPIEGASRGTAPAVPPEWSGTVASGSDSIGVFHPPPVEVEPVVSVVSTSAPMESSTAVVAPQAVETDPQLAAMRSIYERQIARLKAIHDTNSLQWARSYVTELERLRDSMQEAGDLGGWVAAGREISRFADDSTPPNAFLTTRSEPLDALRFEARTRYDEALDSYSRQVVDLGNKYMSHLAEIQSDRTREGAFASAMLVSAAIKHVREGPTHSAAEFHLAAGAARQRATAPPPDPQQDRRDSKTNATPKAVAAGDVSPRPSEPSISRGSVRTPLPGVTFERLSVKPSGAIRSRGNYEISVMCGVSSNLNSRASSTVSRSRGTTETALLHHVVIGLRTTSRTQVVRAPRIRIEYFVTGLGASEGLSTPRRLTVDEVDMDQLDSEWVYIDCPAVETRMFTQSFEGNAFSRQTTGGEKFHGVIVTVLQDGKRPVFEAVAAGRP